MMTNKLRQKWRTILNLASPRRDSCPATDERLIEKMNTGIAKYGEWVPELDLRDHRQEVIDELLDSANYMIMEYIMYRDTKTLDLLASVIHTIRKFEEAGVVAKDIK